MIDWGELIGAENHTGNSQNAPISGARPTALSGDCKKVGRTESSNQAGLDDSAPLAPLAPLKKQGAGLEQENNSPGEGVASDNYCDAKTYPVNPIAVTLLLTCCHKTTINKEETLEAIWKLQTIPQQEQIRSWAMLCQKNGIDPHRVTYPFTRSSNKCTSCQGCKHMEMQKIPTDKRPVYKYICKQQHQILEAYYLCERVLIAPESCRDYLPKA